MSNNQKSNADKSQRTLAAVMAAFVLFPAMPVYAGTPDAPTATITPNTATTKWTNQSAKVSFAIPDYSITATQPTTGGSISVNKNRAKATDTITVTAAPAENYGVDYFVINGTKTEATGTNILSFDMPAKNTTVTAVLKKKNIEVNTLEALAGTGYTSFWSTGIYSDSSTNGWKRIAFEDSRKRAIRPPTVTYAQPTFYTDFDGRDYIHIYSSYNVSVTGGSNHRTSTESLSGFLTRDAYDLGQFTKLRVIVGNNTENLKVCLGSLSGNSLSHVRSEYLDGRRAVYEYDISSISGAYSIGFWAQPDLPSGGAWGSGSSSAAAAIYGIELITE